MSPPSLLVVAPHASRTGSTQVLIDLLTLAGPDLPWPIEVIIQASGPRVKDLRALGPAPSTGADPAMVLVNTCLSADHILTLPPTVPSAVYVHEVGSVIASLPADAARGLRRADLVLCVSEGVRQDLLAAGIDPSRIELLPPVIVPAAPVGASAADAMRSSLGLAAGDRLVLGCGEASERKGSDLFVELGYHLRDDPHIRLLWLGRRLRSIARMLDHDVEQAGLRGRVIWMDEVTDPSLHLAAADIVVATSRSDPQPLIPLEAAQQGTPTVCFAIGGLAELAASGGALGVPYPDVRALADAVHSVLDDPAQADTLVESALLRRDQRQTSAKVVPVFLSAVGRVIATGRRGPIEELHARP